MNPAGSGQPMGGYPGLNANYAAAMMGLANPYAATREAQLAAALSMQARNPYTTGAASGGAYAPSVSASVSSNMYGAPNHYQLATPMQTHHIGRSNQDLATAAAMARHTMPIHPEVKMVRLPFYDVSTELLRPVSLVVQGSNRFQETHLQFQLSPAQATEIASHRDITSATHCEYLYQIQVRFGLLPHEAGKEVPDEFPPSICLQVNGKMAPLPNPIPTNKPGVEPKRPPRPVNITHLCKLSPILPNNISIKWAAEYGKTWVVGIWLVMKLTSADLLDRLKIKGNRDPELTRKMIIEKLNDDDCEVATTTLKVSVACPLGKMRMQVPCRPMSCQHLGCFDALLYLQMNERKPTWNCPVCDSKAAYDSLLIDGYFKMVLESPDLPKDETDIVLERDGSWKPVPKDEDKTRPPSSMPPPDSTSNGRVAHAAPAAAAAASDADEVEVIDLSDDDDAPQPAHALHVQPPPPPPYAIPMQAQPPLPPQEIECIDLD